MLGKLALVGETRRDKLTRMLDNIFDYNEHDRTAYIARVAAALPSGAKVLDAGAGPCRHRRLFAHCDYKAQDFAKFTGEGHSYGELDYICDITAIPVADASFDFVLCSEVFEHIPTPDVAVRELARVLKPTGQMLLTAPFAAGIHMAPFHFCGGFSPYWYRHFLPLAGMEVVSITKNGGFFKLYGQESRRFLTLLTPTDKVGRAMFLPLKALLAIWFRLIVPIACHLLDRFDNTDAFTAGYFVLAKKPLDANR